MPSPEKSGLEEELLPQRSRGWRERTAGRNGGFCKRRRKADLILRAWLSQRSHFRQRRCLAGRERGRCTGADVFTLSRRRENCAKTGRQSRSNDDQTCRCPSIGKHRVVLLINPRLFRSFALSGVLHPTATNGSTQPGLSDSEIRDLTAKLAPDFVSLNQGYRAAPAERVQQSLSPLSQIARKSFARS